MTPSNFLPAAAGPHGRAVPWSCQQKYPIPITPGNHSEYQNIVPSSALFPEPEEYTTLFEEWSFLKLLPAILNLVL